MRSSNFERCRSSFQVPNHTFGVTGVCARTARVMKLRTRVITDSFFQISQVIDQSDAFQTLLGDPSLTACMRVASRRQWLVSLALDVDPGFVQAQDQVDYRTAGKARLTYRYRFPFCLLKPMEGSLNIIFAC